MNLSGILTQSEISTLELLLFWGMVVIILAITKEVMTRDHTHSVAIFSTICFIVGISMLIETFSFIILIINLIFFITGVMYWSILCVSPKYNDENEAIVNHLHKPLE